MMVKICEIAQFTRATPGSSLVTYKTTYSHLCPLRDIVVAELKPKEIQGKYWIIFLV